MGIDETKKASYSIEFEGIGGKKVVSNPAFLADYSLASLDFARLPNLFRFTEGHIEKVFYGKNSGSSSSHLPIGDYTLRMSAEKYRGLVGNRDKEDQRWESLEGTDIWCGNFICARKNQDTKSRNFWHGPILFRTLMDYAPDLEQAVFHTFKLDHEESREEILERILAGLQYQEEYLPKIMGERNTHL